MFFAAALSGDQRSGELRALISAHCDEARRRAEAYGRFYAGRRGSMLLDVVLSRQRRYQETVLPLVAKWEADSEAHSLRWLAAHEPDQKRYGLRSGESATIAALAGNLVSFVDGRGLGEDDACMRWAQAVAGLEHARAGPRCRLGARHRAGTVRLPAHAERRRRT